MGISGGHPCLWTLSRHSALSFGEGVGGKSSARREFTTSWGVYIFWCPFIDFHIGANFFLDRNPLNCDTKKAWNRPVVHSTHWGSSNCLSKSNRQRQSPRRYENHYRKETYIKHFTAPKRVQFMLTRSPRDWYNHTRDIYRWPYSRLWYWLFWKISVCLKHSVDKRLPLCLDCLPTQSPLTYRYVMVDFTTLSTA